MSTKACIGLLLDRYVRWIYLHWDGDLCWAGMMLLEHYNSFDKAKELVMLGDLEAIYPRIEPRHGEVRNKQDLAIGENGQPEITVAYHRDYGNPWHVGSLPRVKHLKKLEDTDIIQKLSKEVHGTYIYLYDEQKDCWIFGTANQNGLREPEKEIHDAVCGVFYPLELWRGIQNGRKDEKLICSNPYNDQPGAKKSLEGGAFSGRVVSVEGTNYCVELFSNQCHVAIRSTGNFATEQLKPGDKVLVHIQEVLLEDPLTATGECQKVSN